MTYGWAILIIAVVLGALFQLGIFNASTFTPKAPPGACHVFRPNGPFTTSFINLQGICNGELPQYAASFSGAGPATVPSSTSLAITNKLTISVWANPSWRNTAGGGWPAIVGNNDQLNGGISLNMGTFGPPACSRWCFLINAIGTGNLCPASACETLGQWDFLVGVYDGSNIYLYQNGKLQGSTAHTGNLAASTSNLMIGGSSGNYPYFRGQISNLQIYNYSLTANEVVALYQEGIGGAPLKLNNLIGWWPLNGDTKDYSGNNKNAQATTGVTFTSSWVSGYSAP